MHRLQSRALGIALGGAAFGGLVAGLASAVSASAATLNDGGYQSGWVYTSTNATSGNQVEVFSRQADGTLTQAGTYNTGGTGTGAGAALDDDLVAMMHHFAHAGWYEANAVFVRLHLFRDADQHPPDPRRTNAVMPRTPAVALQSIL